MSQDSEMSEPKAYAEVVALERSALDKWSQCDTSGYIDISAEDVTWFDFSPGKQLRIDGLEALCNYMMPLGAQVPAHTYEMLNPKVQVYGNVAILTFQWSGSTKDGDSLPKWKVTSIYCMEKGQWRMVHAHWSIVQDE